MTQAQERLSEQLERLGLDQELKTVVAEGLMRLSPGDVSAITSDLKVALDRLKLALDELKASDEV